MTGRLGSGAALIALGLLAGTVHAQAPTDAGPASTASDSGADAADEGEPVPAPPGGEAADAEDGAPAAAPEARAPSAAAEAEPGAGSAPAAPTTAPAPARGPLVPPGGVPPVGPPRPTEPEPPAAPEPPDPPEPAVPPTYDVALHLRGAIAEDTSFDRALRAHGYGVSQILPVAYVGAAGALLEWLWLGGRVGMRGRVWGHDDREEATLFATDLLATAQVRLLLNRVFELGALVGGGVAYQTLRLNGVRSDRITPRFAIEGVVAFRIGNHFAIGPRVGWDWFRWEGMNAYDHDVDVGGAYFGLAVEGRE